MKSRIINDKPLTDRAEQIKEIEDLTQVGNVAAIVEHLTDNPDIPVAEMGENVRNAVLLALLTETAREKNHTTLCELIGFLLEQRRSAKKAPEMDEPFIKEISDEISKELEEEILTFLDDEWPTYTGKE